MAKNHWHLETGDALRKVNSLPSNLLNELNSIFPHPKNNPNETRPSICSIHGSEMWHPFYFDGGFKGIISYVWRCNDCAHKWEHEFKMLKESRKRW